MTGEAEGGLGMASVVAEVWYRGDKEDADG